MPAQACQFFHECTGCGAMLSPKQGDCCVICSYGTVPVRRSNKDGDVAGRKKGLQGKSLAIP